jgi:SAM-dependent methyltransferase
MVWIWTPVLVGIAEQKHRAGRFFGADMTDFRLPQRFDAVICLFSSIGYLRSLDRVTQALARFRDHLTPAGVIIVEPWFAPGMLEAGRTTRKTGEGNGVTVCRVSYVEIDGTISRLHFEYEITDARGTRYTSEVHELGLFSVEELLRVFSEAGLRAEYTPEGLTDRGLYIARIAS